MLSKIQGFMNNFNVQPVDSVQARGARRVEGSGQNPFAQGVTGGQDPYGQYDRGLEHGYGGVQYGNNGAILGKNLNVEW